MSTECSVGLNYNTTSVINDWKGWFDEDFSGTTITNYGAAQVNFNPNGGWGNAMSSVSNYSNRFLMLYTTQNGWSAGGRNTNGSYSSALIVMPNSTLRSMPYGWNDDVQSANIDGAVCNADHFIQTVGNDTQLGGTYTTNFFSSLVSQTMNVNNPQYTLTNSISNNGCTNSYVKLGGTGTLYDALVLGAALYGHTNPYNALVINGGSDDLVCGLSGYPTPGNCGQSGITGQDTTANYYAALTNGARQYAGTCIGGSCSGGPLSWLFSVVQDPNTIANSIQSFCSGTRLNNSVCLAVLNDPGPYGNYATGKALLSSNYTSFCSGTNLTGLGCTSFCGFGNSQCDNQVNTFCTSNASYPVMYPTLCGCWEKVNYGSSIPASLQSVLNATPLCNPGCTNSYHMSSWTSCQIDIQNCINSTTVNLNGSSINELTAVNSAECQQQLGTVTPPPSSNTDATNPSNSSNSLATMETVLTFVETYPLPFVGVIILLLIIIYFLFIRSNK